MSPNATQDIPHRTTLALRTLLVLSIWEDKLNFVNLGKRNGKQLRAQYKKQIDFKSNLNII